MDNDLAPNQFGGISSNPLCDDL